MNRTATNDDDSFLVAKYRSMAKEAKVALDEHQIKALTELDRARKDILSSSMYTHTTSNTSRVPKHSEDDGNHSFIPFMKKVSSFFQNIDDSVSAPGLQSMMQDSPEGVYLHGGVGCGKTFCMDIFYDNLPIKSKQKVHFHKFMLNVHQLMHEAKMIDGVEGDVLPMVIERTVRDGLVICFDEFQVTDVASALILRRLFTGLIEEGAVIIATSNRPPSDLYLNGLQRDLFLPFIDLLTLKTVVVSMWESEVDYRLVQGVNKANGVYFVGKEKLNFDRTFQALTKGSETGPTTLSTQGRSIPIPSASLEYLVARFSFDDLCREARGAADYITIGENFHTVFIEDIPTLTMNDVNIVRRFIVFVDSMYECHAKLIVQAAALPAELFLVDLDNNSCDEAFAFDRTRSRLEEMRSDEYLKSRWVGNGDTPSK